MDQFLFVNEENQQFLCYMYLMFFLSDCEIKKSNQFHEDYDKEIQKRLGFD